MYCMFKDGYMHLHGYTCHVHFRYAISEDKRNVVVSQEAIRSIQKEYILFNQKHYLKSESCLWKNSLY